jgi:hypothetical protein
LATPGDVARQTAFAVHMQRRGRGATLAKRGARGRRGPGLAAPPFFLLLPFFSPRPEAAPSPGIPNNFVE